jgi:hypothetical protein
MDWLPNRMENHGISRRRIDLTVLSREAGGERKSASGPDSRNILFTVKQNIAMINSLTQNNTKDPS